MNTQIIKEPSTRNLSTGDFKQYLDKIQIFASTELGIYLPNPEDLKFKEFEEFYKKNI